MKCSSISVMIAFTDTFSYFRNQLKERDRKSMSANFALTNHKI